ncbi:hypothetical protein AYL99_09695 [Fonsecaea erecta]|uniref:F-box domain-containing protein n=1 Tax=Fonsecaea erecta TaxID=1367422 RepID=A0A178ZAM4_9EURO|nr:hypothetical protein AYL99_09695 [Fonsecaea erecta]OAP56516.1 hypothetical protein AYL99_09695 [Fonsecaea erecta]
MSSSRYALNGLASLPPEVHHMVADYLQYPDLLSLKLTNTYFAGLVEPKLTVKSRVGWVQARYAQHLPVPTNTRLSFKTDALFVGNPEVKAILRRRRRHLECTNHERGSAFVFSMFAAPIDVPAREGARPWTKVCLVTGNGVCPRFQELEAKAKWYKNSVLGRLAGPVLKTIAWLRPSQQDHHDSLTRFVAGTLRASRFQLEHALAMAKIALIILVLCILCHWNVISSPDAPHGIVVMR